MPDFYSKRHHYGNVTYKGILSKKEVEDYLQDHDQLMEVEILINDHTTIVYFTDDYTSGSVFKLPEEMFVPISTPFPRIVSAREGVEDGIVDTIDKHLIVLNFIKWQQNIIVWSYEELQEQLKLHNII